MSGSTNIAPQPRVIQACRSAMKKKNFKFPTKLPNPAPKKLNVTTSQEVDQGGGTGHLLAMDDILLDSDFSNMVFDSSEVGPIEVPSLQTSSQLGDQNGEKILTTDEVENWLMGDNVIVQSKSELNVMSNSENGASLSIYPNNVFDSLEWDWDNLDLDGGFQGEKLWDSEEDKLLSWLWESNSDNGKDGDSIS